MFSIDGESLVNTANFYYAPGDVKQMFWFYEAIEQPSIHYFSSPYTTEDGYSRIFVTKFVKYNYGEGQGVLLMEINSDNIINLSKNANLGANGQIIIIKVKTDFSNVRQNLLITKQIIYQIIRDWQINDCQGVLMNLITNDMKNKK